MEALRTKDAVGIYLISFVLMYAAYFVASMFGEVAAFLNYAIVQVSNIIAVLGYCYLKKWNPNGLISQNQQPLSAGKAGLSVASAVALIVQNMLIIFLFARLIDRLGIGATVELPPLDTAGRMLGGIVMLCVLPAIGEELLFRGVMVTALGKHSPKYALVISALIFALMHFNPAQLVHQFIIGLALAYIYIKTGKLIYCMILHFVNNLLAISLDIVLPQINTLANFETSDIIILCTMTVAGLAACIFLARQFSKNTPRIEGKRPLSALAKDAPTFGLVIGMAVMSIIVAIIS